jgi:nucleoside-diphosphate-sugar epimerase
MKALITGGTGFIGLTLARNLLQRGRLTGPSGAEEEIDSIVLFDNTVPDRRPGGLDERVAIIDGDISDPATVSDLVDRDDMSVFHLASVVSAGGEKDFDLAMRVNLDGSRLLFEACRARHSLPRLVFASSIAVFGGDAMPDTVGDATKQTPQTTYGITKAICEMLINDFSRKGFLDGRTARLPTIIIRPGRPNLAASSFASGVFREPLKGEECILPVALDTRMPLLGYRNAVAGLVALHEADAEALGTDRAVMMPSTTYTVAEMIAALEVMADRNGIRLGPITERRDPAIERIVAGWAPRTETPRADQLGLPRDPDLQRVIQDFIDDGYIK